MNEAPFEIGDLVMRKTWFSRKIRLVNRIWSSRSGWEMLVDTFLWTKNEYLAQYGEVVSTDGWHKI